MLASDFKSYDIYGVMMPFQMSYTIPRCVLLVYIRLKVYWLVLFRLRYTEHSLSLGPLLIYNYFSVSP